MTAQASVLALPDAAITGIDLQGTDLRAGDHLPITVQISNQGTSPLAPVPVVLAIDDRQYAEWKLPSTLAPGAAATWELTWTAVRGPHIVLATVDPLNDVAEPNEANNSGFISLGVGTAPEPSPWPAALAGLGAFLLGALGALAIQRFRRASKRPRYEPPRSEERGEEVEQEQ